MTPTSGSSKLKTVIPPSIAARPAAAMAAAARGLNSISRAAFSWKPTGQAQQTLAAAVNRSAVGLHSGVRVTATLLPARAGEGRYFVVEGEEARVAAEVGNAEARSPLCTTLRSGGGGVRVRTVEHLLSAMEALGVDNCRVELSCGNEIPLLDGSAQEWVEAIRGTGLCAAEDISGQKLEKLAPKIDEPVYLRKNACFIAAFPSPQIHITYGIDFPKSPDEFDRAASRRNWEGLGEAAGEAEKNWAYIYLPSAGNWLSMVHHFPGDNIYSSKIAPARTFCIFEEVEKMRGAGLIKGGSVENAMVCSVTGGWRNPPLRFEDEPCRHKILDLIGDFSLLAQNGNQGFPIAHVVAYKAGHALHTNFLRHLSGTITADQGMLA